MTGAFFISVVDSSAWPPRRLSVTHIAEMHYPYRSSHPLFGFCKSSVKEEECKWVQWQRRVHPDFMSEFILPWYPLLAAVTQPKNVLIWGFRKEVTKWDLPLLLSFGELIDMVVWDRIMLSIMDSLFYIDFSPNYIKYPSFLSTNCVSVGMLRHDSVQYFEGINLNCWIRKSLLSYRNIFKIRKKQ